MRKYIFLAFLALVALTNESSQASESSQIETAQASNENNRSHMIDKIKQISFMLKEGKEIEVAKLIYLDYARTSYDTEKPLDKWTKNTILFIIENIEFTDNELSKNCFLTNSDELPDETHKGYCIKDIIWNDKGFTLIIMPEVVEKYIEESHRNYTYKLVFKYKKIDDSLRVATIF